MNFPGDVLKRADESSSIYQRTSGLADRSNVCKNLKPERSEPRSSSDFTFEVPWELASSPGISIRAEDAWKISRGSPNVTIAIIDECFDIQRLPPNAEVEVLNASDHATYPTRHSGLPHGARLAELIAGNRDGYPGVAPRCRLLLIELPSFCTESEEARAFDLAYARDAAVVCCGWGPAYRGPNVPRPMPACVSASVERLAREGRRGLGTLIFFAAGNTGCNISLDRYSSHPRVTAIGGITRCGRIPHNIDFGTLLAAPVSSPEAVIGGKPGHPAGASGAAALVTGVAGLVFSVVEGLSADQVIHMLKQTSSAAAVNVVDAGKALISSRTTIPAKARIENIIAPSSPGSYSANRQFRERRYNGGEHSYFGLTAAYALQQLYQQAPATPEAAFYGTVFSTYAPASGTPTYHPLVKMTIDAFFANKTPADRTVPSIPNYPCLTTAANGDLPFGYLVGLAADVYGSPSDLLLGLRMPVTLPVGLFFSMPSGNAFYDTVSSFRQEILHNFQYDDDAEIFLENLPDSVTGYIRFAKKNYSHFAGHNLLFYLSHHLLAVNEAIQCGNSTSQAAITTHFNNAVAREAFALHFLTDMFSAGHARDPRWAFLYAGLVYDDFSAGNVALLGPMTTDDAHLISKLIHDYDGTVGCLVANATGSTTTQSYLWKLYGDGSLRLDQFDQADNLIYFNNTQTDSLGNAQLSNEPLQFGKYMPVARAATDNLRRYDLITGLICVSMADVFRHMAQGTALANSAQGGPGNSPGLLGYILERVPFSLPIASALSAVKVTDSVRNNLMTTLYPSVPLPPAGPGYTATELSTRLTDNVQLFATYQKVTSAVKRVDQLYSHQPDFESKYCQGKFNLTGGAPSTQFEKDWVAAQVTNLGKAYSGAGNSGLAAVVPSILTSNPNFASTICGSDNFVAPPLPAEWMAALPTALSQILIANPNGIWGIQP